MHIGTNSKKLDISLESNTKVISEKLANFLKKGDIVYLFGEIGVGKSTFVKYLINFLQNKNSHSITEIPSPTFNILNEYQTGDLKIIHCDLFRVKNKEELDNIGLFENQNDSLILIEWPELLENFNLSNKINFNFEYGENMEKRYLTISTNMSLKFLNEIK